MIELEDKGRVQYGSISSLFVSLSGFPAVCLVKASTVSSIFVVSDIISVGYNGLMLSYTSSLMQT